MTSSAHMLCVLAGLVSSLSLSPPADAFAFQLEPPPARLAQPAQLCAHRRPALCALAPRLAACGRPGVCRLRLSDSMDDMQPEEAMVERLLERLETGIESAVSQERFQEASALRDEISRMHMDDTSSVLRVNSDFYRAFSTKNISLMGTVWHKSPHVQCIHPGAKPLVGYDNIVSMWSNMFQARDQVFKGTDITPSDVRVHVRGTSAFVTCTEEVLAPSGAERRMLATNIYRKLEGNWVLVHHHASQAMVRGNSIEDLLGGASSARVIRIDGSLRDSDGSSGKADSSADDIVDEIVRALQGALEEEQGKSSSMGFPGQVVGSMRFEVEAEDDEESKDKRRERKRSTDEDTDDDDEMLTERELAEGVTERTVAALRKLAKEGLISRDQKRRLLTDVIRHHQQGEEASEVEIAYELLVMRFLPSPESDEPSSSSSANLFAQEEEDLLEDFADQCLILAKRLD
eukprot:Tamp_10569.p1 GENE.Tamp_10569~~Tamp_10569.p1  ORF type:complete len:460 (+),score=141.09 Tamp_10569:183-1562(+)